MKCGWSWTGVSGFFIPYSSWMKPSSSFCWDYISLDTLSHECRISPPALPSWVLSSGQLGSLRSNPSSWWAPCASLVTRSGVRRSASVQSESGRRQESLETKQKKDIKHYVYCCNAAAWRRKLKRFVVFLPVCLQGVTSSSFLLLFLLPRIECDSLGGDKS